MKGNLDDDGNITRTAGVCPARLDTAALRAHMAAQGRSERGALKPHHCLLRRAKSRVPAVRSRIAGTSR